MCMRRKGADNVVLHVLHSLRNRLKSYSWLRAMGYHKMCSLEKKNKNVERKGKKTRAVFGMHYIRAHVLLRRGGASMSSYIGAVISDFILSSLSFASQFYWSAPLFALHLVSISAISLYCRLENAITPSCTMLAGKSTQKPPVLALIEVIYVYFTICSPNP